LFYLYWYIFIPLLSLWNYLEYPDALVLRGGHDQAASIRVQCWFPASVLEDFQNGPALLDLITSLGTLQISVHYRLVESLAHFLERLVRCLIILPSICLTRCLGFNLATFSSTRTWSIIRLSNFTIKTISTSKTWRRALTVIVTHVCRVILLIFVQILQDNRWFTSFLLIDPLTVLMVGLFTRTFIFWNSWLVAFLLLVLFD